jgi:hypothetical protein
MFVQVGRCCLARQNMVLCGLSLSCPHVAAADRYGVPAHEILRRVGEAGYVGGQEDMIIDIAVQLEQEVRTPVR